MQSAVTDYRLRLEGQLHMDWDCSQQLHIDWDCSQQLHMYWDCSQQLQIIDWDWRSRSRRMEVDEVVSQFGSLQTHDQVRFMSCHVITLCF